MQPRRELIFGRSFARLRAAACAVALALASCAAPSYGPLRTQLPNDGAAVLPCRQSRGTFFLFAEFPGQRGRHAFLFDTGTDRTLLDLPFAHALGLAGTLAAQTPAIDSGGVVNAASYAYAGLPSAGIAQGSIFAIFGNNLGPTPSAQLSGFPIPTTLGGVTVRVTSGSTSGNAYLFLTSAKQITGMLPSNIAVGTASLTVTANGATSAPQAFQVVASSFGTFALNSGGSGPEPLGRQRILARTTVDSLQL
jgi:hypothetical protein